MGLEGRVSEINIEEGKDRDNSIEDVMATGERAVHNGVGPDGFQEGALKGAAADTAAHQWGVDSGVHGGPVKDVVEA